jgi:hypothetical protein
MELEEERLSWHSAYWDFLRSEEESRMLRFGGPAVAVGMLPPDAVANLIPFIGEAADVGYLGAVALLAIKTLIHVRRYR